MQSGRKDRGDEDFVLQILIQEWKVTHCNSKIMAPFPVIGGDGLRTGWPGFDSRQVQDSPVFNIVWGQHSLLYNGDQRLFPRG